MKIPISTVSKRISKILEEEQSFELFQKSADQEVKKTVVLRNIGEATVFIESINPEASITDSLPIPQDEEVAFDTHDINNISLIAESETEMIIETFAK